MATLPTIDPPLKNSWRRPWLSVPLLLGRAAGSDGPSPLEFQVRFRSCLCSLRLGEYVVVPEHVTHSFGMGYTTRQFPAPPYLAIDSLDIDRLFDSIGGGDVPNLVKVALELDAAVAAVTFSAGVFATPAILRTSFSIFARSCTVTYVEGIRTIVQKQIPLSTTVRRAVLTRRLLGYFATRDLLGGGGGGGVKHPYVITCERIAAERRATRRSKALDETILKHPLNFPNEVTC